MEWMVQPIKSSLPQIEGCAIDPCGEWWCGIKLVDCSDLGWCAIYLS